MPDTVFDEAAATLCIYCADPKAVYAQIVREMLGMEPC